MPPLPPPSAINRPGLLTFWDFAEEPGADRVARGPVPYRLRDLPGSPPVARVSEGVFGPHAARFRMPRAGEGRPAPALYLPRTEMGALNIHGPRAAFSLVAWLRRERSDYAGCQAVAGVWNEHGKRQYCLFLNLRIHESAEQVGAHVSAVGGPTPGFKYCMDAAIGATPVAFDRWSCVAITYDGRFAKAYQNGHLDARGKRNPYHYEGGLFDGGPHGADFTVGAVTRPARVDAQSQEHGSIIANPFVGDLGGLAVYDRALSDAEMQALATLTPT